MSLEDRHGDVDQLAPGASRLVAQHLERLALVDLVALHQNALGPLGARTSPERALQVVVLGEPPQRDVERALQSSGVAVHDVREDTALRRLVDERRVPPSRTAITGQSASQHDALDQLEGVRRAGTQADQGDVGMLSRVRGPTSRTSVDPAMTVWPSRATRVVTSSMRSSRSFAISTRRCS